ncbi:hypothetical protein ACFY6U_12730 [Streptomyces sp. NPDC013157]|uniref:hypothetical protein n=1 Tax=Streptomyces sp. NPDC013157 TaxID=3364861 RepID=UPI00368DF820
MGIYPDDLASGLINTVQQVGGAPGLGVLASIASSATKSSQASSQAVALTHGFSHGFLIAAIVAIIATLLTLLLISNRDSREHARAAQRGQAPSSSDRHLRPPEAAQRRPCPHIQSAVGGRQPPIHRPQPKKDQS